MSRAQRQRRFDVVQFRPRHLSDDARLSTIYEAETDVEDDRVAARESEEATFFNIDFDDLSAEWITAREDALVPTQFSVVSEHVGHDMRRRVKGGRERFWCADCQLECVRDGVMR